MLVFPCKRTAIASALALMSFSSAADVTVLGTGSSAQAISGDGNVVVGTDYDTGLAYKWNGATAVVLGGLLGYTDNTAYGVSSDGGVIAGTSSKFDSDFNYISQAFKWTAAGGIVALNALSSGQSSSAAAVSANANVIVGKAYLADGVTQHAVRWVGASSTIEDISGGAFTGYSSGLATSADGSVVVGYGESGSNYRAFRWVSGSGMTDLGALAGRNSSEATAVSSDGSVVAGNSYTLYASTADNHAFRWTAADGMVDLGTLNSAALSFARGMNADGSVIVGDVSDASYSFASQVAFRWTQSGGMQSVADWLAANGVSVGSSIFTRAFDVSDDGNVVVGSGTINGQDQSYIARVGSSSSSSGGSSGSSGGSSGGTGVIGLIDFTNSLASASTSIGAISQRYGLTLWGSHHRTLMDSGLVNQNGTGVWVTGDYAYQNNTDSRQVLGEVGVFHDVNPHWRLGVGAGMTGVKQRLAYEGENNARGGYVVMEADYAPTSRNDWIISVTGLYGKMNASIRRGYLNGGVLDASTGESDALTTAIRFRVDKRDVMALGKFTISPFASYSYSQAELDAYTETGGGFPAAYNAQKMDNNELRLGAVGKTALTNIADLRLTVEAVTAKTKTDAVTGLVLGAGGFAFGFAATDETQTWGRLGADVDYRLAKNSVISSSLFAASNGLDATWSGSVSWKRGF